MKPSLCSLDFEERNLEISYISDIHLEWRFHQEHCETESDRLCTLQRIAKTIGEQSTQVNLIAGDTADSVETFSLFVQQLSLFSKGDYFFVLGNHEYYAFRDGLLPLTDAQLVETEQAYRDVLERHGNQRMHLVQDNLFFLGRDGVWHEVNKTELVEFPPEKLQTAADGAVLVIFGAVDVSPYDPKTISALETDYSFLKRKVVETFETKRLILLTHGIDEELDAFRDDLDEFRDPYAIEIAEIYEGKAIWVCGHTHHNEMRDDGEKRIYADNQIARRGKVYGLKKFTLCGRPDLFRFYENGIYDISEKDYFEFHRGNGTFVPRFDKLDHLNMIKRKGLYAFIAQTPSGKSFLLDYETFLDIGETTPEQIYSDMDHYFDSMRMFLSDYEVSLERLASEICFVGGDGSTHGCIVDIDRENHLFLNPFDHSVVSYNAKTTKERRVFENVPSLLRVNCSSVYRRYKRMGRYYHTDLCAISQNGSAVVSKESFIEADDEMYKISKAVAFAKQSVERGIVRFWMDSLADLPSYKQGESIVRGIAFAKRRKCLPKGKAPKPFHVPKPKVVTPKTNAMIQKASPDEVYKEKLRNMSDGKIECLSYRGAAKKADYRCLACRYEWSSRPDHLKDRYHYCCPRCSGVRIKSRLDAKNSDKE